MTEQRNRKQMQRNSHKPGVPSSERRTFTPKRVDKKTRIIRDPQKFAEFITKRDRTLLDRLEEYDRKGSE
jgi:hypothetical protein